MRVHVPEKPSREERELYEKLRGLSGKKSRWSW